MVETEIRKIAFLGDYLPRKCGIATFTSDLHKSIASQLSNTRCFVVPVNDLDCGYEYPPEVRFEIAEQDLQAYRRAADFLNLSNVDVVSVQHEFGIYGGPAGSHLLALVRDLKMPLVTTFHTLLREPNRDQRRVMAELVQQSTRVVVMTRRGQEILEEVYQTPSSKIDVIPHGIPDVPFIDPNYFKDQFGVEGKQVLLTFGLLSPNKGIEHVLNAMPEILAAYPNVVYIILGATHPNLVRDQGEAYRTGLERLAKKNKIEKNVIFYNRFVEIEELKEFIGAADIYVTPYLNEAQITSGTLAYAFGAGKAIVSTPYWHAQELLSDGRGAMVPFGNPQAIAREVVDLLRDETRRHSMRKNAYKAGREMVWQRVGQMYMDSFSQARHERGGISRKVFAIKTLDQQPRQLPELKLDHLQRMTDSTGMFQHATYSVPNFAEGYCTDDNARALMLTVLLEQLGEDSPQVRALATRYAAFLHYAYSPKTKLFRNFMTFDRRWAEEVGSEDCNGRALWALGLCVGRSRRPSFQNLAGDLFHRVLPSAIEFTAPRAWALCLLGIQEYLQRLSGDRLAEQIRDSLTGRLVQLFEQCSADDWAWCGEEVTYDNPRLAQALIQCGSATGQQNTVEWGLRALRWLTEIQTSEEGHFRPIGCKGFFCRNGHRAQFDQQPIEACAMISACLEAYRVTSDPFWQDQSTRAFDWFLGWNDLGLELYSANSGGSYDGLHVDRVNANQGAESTLSFLTSLAEMKLMQNAVATSEQSAESGWNAGAQNTLELEKVGFTDNFAPAVKHR